MIDYRKDMDINNYNQRKEIQDKLKRIGSEIDTAAQSTMLKEVVYMFASNDQFKECEQIVSYFRAKLQKDDLSEIEECVLKPNR